MSSFGHFGLALLCVALLLSHPAHGNRCETKFMVPGVVPSCCPKSSKAYIEEPVEACFVQKSTTFVTCKIEAYIFMTFSNKQYCVDPSASWLPHKLQELEQEGIICKLL
ncbi:unnamed protein product [Ophioblennius macclurei]